MANENSAQAGDEPMPGIEYEIELLPCVYPGTVPQLKTAYEAGHRHALRAAGEYVRQKLAAQVSPRATADAARYQYLMRELGGSISMDLGLDCVSEIDSHIDAAIATTKPGV
jgi:hypothetical protein